jgi:hypothetical protein
MSLASSLAPRQQKPESSQPIPETAAAEKHPWHGCKVHRPGLHAVEGLCTSQDKDGGRPEVGGQRRQGTL